MAAIKDKVSSVIELGDAVRCGDISILQSDLESIIQRIVKLIKSNSFNVVAVTGLISVVKELLKRLSTLACPAPPCLSNLTKAIFKLTADPSQLIQATCLECLSALLQVYPSSLKTYTEAMKQWAKTGLYSGHTQFTQESAILIVSLHSSIGRAGEMSQLFEHCLDLLEHSLKQLTGEEDSTLLNIPMFYYTPMLPFEGQERLATLFNVISGISRVLCYSLTISNGSFVIPLDRLISVLWFATSCQLMSPSLSLRVQQVSWQLFLVVIQSCGTHLLPYSQSIEAGMVGVLQNERAPALITSLVCRCVEEWVTVRKYCSQVFVSHTVGSLCLTGHKCIKKLASFSNKKQIACDGPDVWLLYYCICGLNACLNVPFTQHKLPGLLLKGLLLLGRAVPRDMVPPCLVAKSEELVKLIITKSACVFNLQEAMSSVDLPPPTIDNEPRPHSSLLQPSSSFTVPSDDNPPLPNHISCNEGLPGCNSTSVGHINEDIQLPTQLHEDAVTTKVAANKRITSKRCSTNEDKDSEYKCKKAKHSLDGLKVVNETDELSINVKSSNIVDMPEEEEVEGEEDQDALVDDEEQLMKIFIDS